MKKRDPRAVRDKRIALVRSLNARAGDIAAAEANVKTLFAQVEAVGQEAKTIRDGTEADLADVKRRLDAARKNLEKTLSAATGGPIAEDLFVHLNDLEEEHIAATAAVEQARNLYDSTIGEARGHLRQAEEARQAAIVAYQNHKKGLIERIDNPGEEDV